MRTRTILAAVASLAVGALLAWLALGRLSPDAQAQEKTSGGDSLYRFAGGFPTPVATQQASDDADYQRAVVAYRFWYPTVSCEGIFNGDREQGLKDNESAPILAAGPRHVGFTLNSDTPYCGAVVDVKDDPYVIELPPGPFVGAANDHHQGWILDMGLAGPDGGRGGKHLILPPGNKGAVPNGYFVGRSSSYKVLIALRALPARGDAKAALEALKSVKIYPLSTAAAPKLVKFVDMTEKKTDNTLLRWEDNLQFWQKLHEVIDAEPLVDQFRPMYGLLAAIGIEKGKPFPPPARLQAILERAAKAGRAQLLVAAFDSIRPERLAWSDRKWEWLGLVPDRADFETPGGVDLKARDRYFAQAILTSPAMFRRKQGSGSLYWLGHRDATGAFVDGGKTYRLAVPQPVPAGLFWSVTVYDAATRSEVQTAQDRAALRSLYEKLTPDVDESTRLYFGPKAPAGKEAQWIQTIPGRGWFAYFRIYGPKEAAFDGTWRPGDFEEVK
jgi:hypothetical protein